MVTSLREKIDIESSVPKSRTSADSAGTPLWNIECIFTLFGWRVTATSGIRLRVSEIVRGRSSPRTIGENARIKSWTPALNRFGLPQPLGKRLFGFEEFHEKIARSAIAFDKKLKWPRSGQNVLSKLFIG